MDKQERAHRPTMSRPPSSSGDTSPPHRNQTALRQALPSLHLPNRHTHHHLSSHGRQKRHADKNPVAHAALHTPTAVPARLAEKIAPNSRSSSKTGREAQAEDAEAATSELPSRQIRPVDVAKERHRRVRRDEELRSTVNGLTDMATSSTRKIDLLFLGIMEKVSTLRNTIGKLQELSEQSSKAQHDFEEEAGETEKDYAAQIETFRAFETQKGQVEMLRNRVQHSVEKSEQLNERLKKARDRVALWERREDEWQANTTKKLRIGWACFGTLVGLILVILLVRAIYLRTGYAAINARLPELNTSDIDGLWQKLQIARPAKPLQLTRHAGSEDYTRNDQRLRRLDEL